VKSAIAAASEPTGVEISNGIGPASVSSVPPWDLQERTRLFALWVLKVCRGLPATQEAQEASGQLRRAANAVRTNYRAARRGRSRAEFRAKLGTVFEEADECVDWLTYLRDADIEHDPALLQEAEELARIFARSVRSARTRNR
jgi:four helix bundle protein